MKLLFFLISLCFGVSYCWNLIRNPFCSRKMSSISTPLEWDHELGVWIGEKAPGIDPKDFPNPFYVFGYGSLIWKMGPLEKFPHFSGQAIGFKRLFAQRSYDHRGNKYFPGLVLNLVNDEILSKNGFSLPRSPKKIHHEEPDGLAISSSDAVPSVSSVSSVSLSEGDCDGLVWLVPQEEILPLIEYLDFREKGGYFQTFIDVRLQEDSEHHKKDDIVKALVYIGHDHNPNFFLPSSPVRSSSSSSFHDFQSRSTVSDIISTAVGPSGSNIEYLFNLHADLLSRGIHDQYLHNLVMSVRQRIGIWRRKHFYHKIFAKHHNRLKAKGKLLNEEEDCSIPVKLGGFGSNEFNQLTGKYQAIEDQDSEVYHDQCYFCPVEITEYLPEVSRSKHSPSVSSTEASHIVWNNLENYHVLAGSNSSAFVDDVHHTIRIWGKLGETILNKHYFPFISKLEGENIMNKDPPFSIIVKGITGASIGYDHALLRLGANSFLVCLGDNELAGGDGPSSFVIPSSLIKLVRCSSSHVYRVEYPSSYDSSLPKYQILKIVTNIHHSAVITECGGLITWGKKKFGQVLDQEIWYPPVDRNTGNPTKLIDVACGVRHTVVLDDHGWIHSMGDNTYNSLGRQMTASTDSLWTGHPLVDNTMQLVQVPTDVKFQRVRLAVSTSISFFNLSF
jgi:cation transport regulator ChaC